MQHSSTKKCSGVGGYQFECWDQLMNKAVLKNKEAAPLDLAWTYPARVNPLQPPLKATAISTQN